MKIENVKTYRLMDHYLLVEVYTDGGIVGLGESGLWGYPDAVEQVILSFKNYLVGQDPLCIEHHYQYLYRNCHFRGAAISAALSALDIALWDIKGKHHQAPVWELLGGRTRDRIRCFATIHSFDEPDTLARRAREAVKRGFTAVRITPFPSDYEKMGYSQLIQEMIARVAAVRDEVGWSVDIGVEIHRRLGPLLSVGLARELVSYRILFYEDPLLPDSIQAKGKMATQIPLPIASGERLHNIHEFRELLETGACKFIRPDVALAGGITQCKKIIGMAESYQLGVIPHGPLTGVCTAATAQLGGCVPNVILHEYTRHDEPPLSKLLKKMPKMDGGFLLVSDEPGIGAELNHEALDQFRPRQRPLETLIGSDGSVVDR